MRERKSKHERVRGFPGGGSGKERAFQCRRRGSIPGSGVSPGGGHGNLLPYSCLGNPMDGGAWRATIRGVATSWTQLKQFSSHTQTWMKSFHTLQM